MAGWYRADLAFIHDAGHGDFALGSAPGVLDLLAQNEVREGLVVDLGCGSGLWARKLMEAGYRALGIDISKAMIQLARERAPEAKFRVGSLFETAIPQCDAVTALGEVLNYVFEPEDESRSLARLFRRVHDALNPGGVFVFDVAQPGQVAPGVVARRGFSEGEGWVVLVEKEEEGEMLARRITSFRKVGEHYRRDGEVHLQRLYKETGVAEELRRANFQVRTTRSYGRYDLPSAHVAFVARKPK